MVANLLIGDNQEDIEASKFQAKYVNNKIENLHSKYTQRATVSISKNIYLPAI